MSFPWFVLAAFGLIALVAAGAFFIFKFFGID